MAVKRVAAPRLGVAPAVRLLGQAWVMAGFDMGIPVAAEVSASFVLRLA